MRTVKVEDGKWYMVDDDGRQELPTPVACSVWHRRGCDPAAFVAVIEAYTEPLPAIRYSPTGHAADEDWMPAVMWFDSFELVDSLSDDVVPDDDGDDDIRLLYICRERDEGGIHMWFDPDVSDFIPDNKVHEVIAAIGSIGRVGDGVATVPLSGDDCTAHQVAEKACECLRHDS